MSFKSQLCAAILTLSCSSLTANAMVGNDAAKENKIQHYQPSAENLESRKQFQDDKFGIFLHWGLYSMLATCLLYTSPSPRDRQKSRMPSSA